jgi:hypothetical protein
MNRDFCLDERGLPLDERLFTPDEPHLHSG